MHRSPSESLGQYIVLHQSSPDNMKPQSHYQEKVLSSKYSSTTEYRPSGCGRHHGLPGQSLSSQKESKSDKSPLATLTYSVGLPKQHVQTRYQFPGVFSCLSPTPVKQCADSTRSKAYTILCFTIYLSLVFVSRNKNRS